MGIKLDGGLEDFIRELERAQVDINKACIKAVDKAAPILQKSLMEKIENAANRGYATGALAGSVSAMKAKENEYGVFSVVGPVGKDANGIQNAEKLLWLENGTRRKGGNVMKRAGPVRRQAANAAKNACEKAMQDAIENCIDEIFSG